MRHVLVVALIAFAVAACGGTASAPTPPPLSETASATTTPSTAITTDPVNSSGQILASGPPVGSDAAYQAYGAAFCSAFDELFTAYGNPDTGSQSDLFNAFEAAIEAGDAASIDRSASQVKAHLRAGRAHAAAAAAAWQPAGPMTAQLDRLFVAFEAMTDAVRASSNTNAGQAAFEKAGGVEAWTALFQAFGEMDRPAGLGPMQCPNVPVGY